LGGNPLFTLQQYLVEQVYILLEAHCLIALCIGGIVLVLVTLFLPETVRKTRPTIEDDNIKGNNSVFRNLSTAFAPMAVMLGDPTILIMTLYGSIIFASLFFLVKHTCINVSLPTDVIYICIRIQPSQIPLKRCTTTTRGKLVSAISAWV